MKSEEEVRAEYNRIDTRMYALQNNRQIDQLSRSEFIDWIQMYAQRQILYWVMMK